MIKAKNKIGFLLLALVFLQCHTRYLIYQRNRTGLHEQIEINLKNSKFFYHSDSASLTYSTNGTLWLSDSILGLEFPPYSETESLSPFTKGYSVLLKIGESAQMEIDATAFDVRNRWKLGPNRHFKPNIEILSPVDSSLIRKLSYPFDHIIDTPSTILLRTKFPGYYEQYIQIHDVGHFKLTFYLQPIETFTYYETTTEECIRGEAGPTLYLDVCEIKNNLMTILCVPGDSLRKYDYSGIKKRTLRLF